MSTVTAGPVQGMVLVPFRRVGPSVKPPINGVDAAGDAFGFADASTIGIVSSPWRWQVRHCVHKTPYSRAALIQAGRDPFHCLSLQNINFHRFLPCLWNRTPVSVLVYRSGRSNPSPHGICVQLQLRCKSHLGVNSMRLAVVYIAIRGLLSQSACFTFLALSHLFKTSEFFSCSGCP